MREHEKWRPDLKECQNVLEKLVRVNTCQPEGNEAELVDIILKMLPQNEDVKTECIRIEHTAKRASLIVKLCGQSEEGGIAFIGHIDTVACNDLEQWAYPPHQAAVNSGVLYGRGSSDMKGGVAAMFLTLRHIVDEGIQLVKPVYFCFTADEENKGLGIRAIAEGDYLRDVEKIIICEPSDEKIGICEKGALWLRVETRGIASHASRPDLGTNAIEYTIQFANEMKEQVAGTSAHAILGSTTVSITQFNGGIMTNIIPSNTDMELDIRTVPGVSHEHIIDKANAVCRRIMDQYPSVKMEVQVLNNRPALETPVDSEFVVKIMECAKEAGISTVPKGLYFYTDASQFIPKHNVPFVIAGPGNDALAHCVNEHIKLDSVVRYTELYNRCIEEYNR